MNFYDIVMLRCAELAVEIEKAGLKKKVLEDIFNKTRTRGDEKGVVKSRLIETENELAKLSLTYSEKYSIRSLCQLYYTNKEILCFQN